MTWLQSGSRTPPGPSRSRAKHRQRLIPVQGHEGIRLGARGSYLCQQVGIRQDSQRLLQRLKVLETDDDRRRAAGLGDRDPSVLGLNLLDNLREPVFHFSQGQLLTGTSPNVRDLHALDKYCVPAPHDTQSRKRGKPAGATERNTRHRVKCGPVTSAAESVAEERHDASGVGARGVQGREGGSPTHDV